MLVKVPYENSDGTTVEKEFDTDAVVLTEENLNEQAMVISKLFTEWSLVYAQYKRKLLLLEAKHSKWLAQAKQVVIDSTKLKYNSETAKMDAVLTYKDETGNFVYAENELIYNNKRAEILYYIDVVESAVLKALSIEKDMIVSLGAQMRAGYANTVNQVSVK